MKNQAPRTFKISDEQESQINDSSKNKFEFPSRNIQIPYLNLIKYSRIVQEEVLKTNIFNLLYVRLKETPEAADIHDDSIITFTRLLNDEEVEFKNDQFIDLMKLSNIFKVDQLSACLKKQMKKRSNDVDFILNLKIAQEKSNDQNLLLIGEYSAEIEECLRENINEVLENEKIGELSVSSIYRIIENSSSEKISDDLLCRFITEKIEERHVMLQFVNLENLSEEIFNEFFDKYTKVKEKSYFDFLPNNIDYIMKLRNKQKSLEKKIELLEKKQNELDKINKNLRKENENLEKQKNDEINEIKEDFQKLEKQKNDELNEREKVINNLEIVKKQLEFQTKVEKQKDEIVEFIRKNEEQYNCPFEISYIIIKELLKKYGNLNEFRIEGIY